MVIYYLYHEYELYENCMERKAVGFFDSKAEVEELINKYQKLPGFEDYPENFYVQEIIIDNLTETSSQTFQIINNKDIYAVHEVKYYKEYDQEVGNLLGCFITLSEAENFVKTLKPKPLSKDIDIYIEISEQKIGLAGWCYGFQKSYYFVDENASYEDWNHNHETNQGKQ